MGRRRKREKLSGSKRMKELGYKQVTIWLDLSEQEQIGKVCLEDQTAVATYVRLAAVRDASCRLKQASIEEAKKIARKILHEAETDPQES